MAIITCWQDIEDRGGNAWLTPAEQKLITACRAEEACTLGDGTLPPDGTPDPDRRVRAEVLRYLILGGCDRCKIQGWGVNLAGAYVEGQLDLSFQTAKGETSLQACRFGQMIIALQARFQSLNVNESHLPGLNAQAAQISGNVFLRSVTTTGELSLAGASIRGQLDCEGARFTGTENNGALTAEGAQVAGSVFLRGITATGELSLAEASIGGQLDCEGAHFTGAKGKPALNAQDVQVTTSVFLRGVTATGEIRLSGASIGGQFACEDARFAGVEGERALNAQRLQVTDSFFWRRVTVEAGSVDLSAAHIGDLVDDPDCWPDGGRLYLDGFTYDRISGALTDASTRLRWLAKGDSWGGIFFPQPYTQLAKVLREMGHDRDARKVLARREQKIQADIRQRLHVELDGSFRTRLRAIRAYALRPGLWVWDQLLRWVVGYGYYPFRSLLSLLGLWAVAVWLSHMAWTSGDFAPNSGPVQMSDRWQALAVSVENPAALWSSAAEAGRDWETFNRYAWAADLVIPIIDLGQTAAWAPSTERGNWGRRLWRYGFLLQMAGWIVTALGAAAITGIIRRD
ncbi:translocation/assembly module TamB domain-containing protein [Pseudodonghicola flavimaris]|uniref:Membrane-associated oxidoreductase n=1 Tax=Pseudodonghicola flavimaris TaxID=3050036 RepID=A0ABT7F3H0_9RHOB|nr:hypothetical protein [Pseudodonghicola flavimaris]MDK3019146.1 hypothetical protein [Pseudodonghicola flavimaris]